LPATSGTVLTQNSSAPANSLAVDSSGNVGIGTASPVGSVQIVRSSNPQLIITDDLDSSFSLGTTSGYSVIGTDAAAITFKTGVSTGSIFSTGTERMRITTNGGVAFGGASNYGSSGQVLTSNGDAAPSWQAASGLGVGQTWTSVSRANNTYYTNSTGKPIAVSVSVVYGSNNDTYAYVDGKQILLMGITNNYQIRWSLFFIVPNGVTYLVYAPSGINSWWELR
jgi:hypothetical protein